jgi:hypothetical protein
MTHQQSKDVLQSPASYAAMKELHDGRLGITVTAQHSNHWWAAILAMVFGPVAVVVGATRRSDWFFCRNRGSMIKIRRKQNSRFA